MNLSELSIKRPVSAIMVMIIVIVLGVVSLVGLPMDLLPEIELPVAMVITTYSGASPEEVESMITETVESAVASVEGLDTILSYSLEGTSMVGVRFAFNTNMDSAVANIKDSVSLVESYLPDGAGKPMVMKLDMNMMPSVMVYVSSSEKSLEEITSIMEDDLSPRVERANGVASVSRLGALEKEISVVFDQEALSSYGLSLSTVAQLLAAENINLPSGNIARGDTEMLVRSVGKFKSVEEIRNMPLRIGDGSVVRLGNIASVNLQYAEQDSITRINHNPAVAMMVSKQSDANTVTVSRNVSAVLDTLSERHPELQFTVVYDAADYILSAIRSVANSALLGALLAVIVVFLFLCNLRTTAIIALSIPTSLLAAFAAMNALNITLNLITLCALTISVGMLVDNSIVVLENIFRIRQDEPDPNEAALKGSKEIFIAVLMSTLTTVCVFLPIALTNGLASMIFGDFCWTIIIALLASLLVALTLVPMLCSKIMVGRVSSTYIRIGRHRYKYRIVVLVSRFVEYLKNRYEVLVRGVLRARKRFLAGSIAVFLASLLLLFTLGLELLPNSDQGELTVNVELPYGTSLATTDRIMGEIEDYIISIPEVKHEGMSTGALTSFSLSSDASINVDLVPRSERSRSAADVAKQIERELSTMTEAKITAESSSSMSSYLGSSDISLLIKGSEFEVIEEIGYDLTEKLRAMDCVTKAELDLSEGSPEVQVILNRNTAAFYGVTAYQLANGLSNAINGATATRVSIDGDEIEVKLSLSDKVSASVEDMENILISGNYGMSVPVGQIATLVYDNSPSYIYRENQVNAVSLNIDVEGTSVNGGASEVMRFIDNYRLPDGYFIEENGSYSRMMESFQDLAIALFVAIALVFLILAAQFESVLMSIVVMMAVPFAMSGAFLALFLTGTSLSLTSFIGLIMLVGTVVNNSILLVEFIRQYEDELGMQEALVQAGKLRLRPILMSAVTTIVGMIPLSLGLGDGGEMLAPMGISIMGGLAASTVVTLFIIPVFYSLIYEGREKREARRARKREETEALESRWAEEDALASK